MNILNRTSHENSMALGVGNIDYVWSIAIFAARESAEDLFLSIESTMKAATERSIIDVLVNGNYNLALQISELIANNVLFNENIVIRVWYIKLADKANTWNQYLHNILIETKLTFFIDGYVRPSLNSFVLLDSSMSAQPTVLAGTGVPSSGRTATKIREFALKEGGLHGNLFAFKKHVIKEIRERNIRLPLGLYGYDGLLGAMISFRLNPAIYSWDSKSRILVNPDVTWSNEEKKWWRYSDVKGQLQRKSKQALRRLVVKAVQDYFAVNKGLPEKMPMTVAELIISWANKNPIEFKLATRYSLRSRLAFRKINQPKDWSNANVPPQLIYALGHYCPVK